MRRRAKISTNNSNSGKGPFKGDEQFENVHILIYQTLSFSTDCPPFLSPLVVPLTLPQLICLLAISHNQKYLSALPSNSSGLSWSLYFCYSLFSHCSLSIYLSESHCVAMLA